MWVICHQVVVHHVRQVVGREAIRLQQHRVFQRPRVDRDLAADEVGEADLPLQRHLQAHDTGFTAGLQLRLYLRGRQVAAVPVVAGRQNVPAPAARWRISARRSGEQKQ